MKTYIVQVKTHTAHVKTYTVHVKTHTAYVTTYIAHVKTHISHVKTYSAYYLSLLKCLQINQSLPFSNLTMKCSHKYCIHYNEHDNVPMTFASEDYIHNSERVNMTMKCSHKECFHSCECVNVIK